MNANWYDVFVVGALLFGVWSGIRTGLTGELVRTLGLALMILLAMEFYQPVGGWVQQVTRLQEAPAHLVAFVGIAVGTYLVTLAVRAVLHRRWRRRPCTAVVENIGGALAGLVRMTILMVLLTVTLCLVRSPFWRRQVAQESRLGAFLISRLPAVEGVINQPHEEKLWFLGPIRRRAEPGIEPATNGPAS